MDKYNMDFVTTNFYYNHLSLSLINFLLLSKIEEVNILIRIIFPIMTEKSNCLKSPCL